MVLKELRLRHGYTQQEVAKAIGVSVSTYRRYENKGCLRSAPVTRAYELSKLYGVSTDYILFNL